MAITKEQITAALKKLGPTSPGALADHLGVDALPAPLLKDMLDAGEIKAAGVSRARRLALPDQKLDSPGAPPQKRKKPRKGKMAKAKPRAPKPAAKAARDFLTAITADKRLVVISDDDLHVYSETETASIRELMEEV